MANTIPLRSKINKKFTWNAESVFKSAKEWEAEVAAILADLPNVKKFEGRLGESADVLLEGMRAVEALANRTYKIFMYAGFSYSVDTTNQKSAALFGKAQGVAGQVSGALSFVSPELIAMGKAKLDEWMKGNEKLAVYRHSFEDLFRQQAHVRSGEVEELLGMVGDPFGGAQNSSSMLVNADFKFAPAKDKKGKKVEITQGNMHTSLMEHPDRKVRQSAFESYMDKHLEFRNTLAANLNTSIKNNIFNMRARKFDTSLGASLFGLNIPESVFHNLINTFKKKLPVWHRYFELRRKALGLRDVTYYDMWAPIVKSKPKVPYNKAVDLISESLAPLGKEYVDVLRQGCLKDQALGALAGAVPGDDGSGGQRQSAIPLAEQRLRHVRRGAIVGKSNDIVDGMGRFVPDLYHGDAGGLQQAARVGRVLDANDDDGVGLALDQGRDHLLLAFDVV